MPSSPSYVIELIKRRNRFEILFKAGSEGELATLVRLGGKQAQTIFNSLVDILSKRGGLIPLSTSDDHRKYSIRDDLGPIVGAFLILVRRSWKPMKWIKISNEIMEGKYPGLAQAFEYYLEMAIDLSKANGRRGKGYSLSPKVLNAISVAMKKFLESYIKIA